MNLKGLGPWRAAVDAELDRMLPPGSAAPRQVHAAMRYAVLGGGKRVRPLLALAVGDALGVPLETLLLPAACLELVHASSLILDDLPSMDDDLLRRGRPSCHAAHGEAAAILAATGLLLLSFESLAGALHSGSGPLIGELSRAAGTRGGLIAGQARDLWPETTLDETELAQTHEQKTGCLFGAAVAFAAHLAGLDEARVAPLRAAGVDLGLAFQIADDVTDSAADASDARLGRGTFAAFSSERARARGRSLAEAAANSLVTLTGSPSLGWLAGMVDV